MRIAAISVVAALIAAALAAGASAALVGLYRNPMESAGQRAQIAKLSGERCRAGGSDHAYRVYVGKATSECSYRTPVIGRDLEVAVTARLLEGTPRSLRRKAYVAANLRAGNAGARYQLVLFPLQRKAQLRRVDSAGKVKYLAIEHGLTVKGLNGANQLRLQAFNLTSGAEKGNCRIFAWVGRQRVAAVSDPAAGELQGRTSGFSLGAAGNAKGALASFDDVVVRAPSPY